MDKHISFNKREIIKYCLTGMFLILSITSFILSAVVFNVNASGTTLDYYSEYNERETLDSIGSSGSDGIFITSYTDNDSVREFIVRLLCDDNSISLKTNIERGADGDEKDNGSFRSCVGITDNRILTFTQNWYYLFEKTEDSLNLLDVYMADLSVTDYYTYDVLDNGDFDIYNLQTKGTTSTALICIEKISVKNDRFVSSKSGEIKKVVGSKKKRLDNIGAMAEGIAVTKDHSKVIVLSSAGSAYMFGSDLSVLDITDPETYSENLKTIKLGSKEGVSITASASRIGYGELYVGLQDNTIQRITETDFENYGKEDYEIDIVASLDEYATCMEFDNANEIVYSSNEDGNTVYAVNVEKDDLLYTVQLKFGIKHMAISNEANQFVCQWTDVVTGEIMITTYSLKSLSILNSSKVWRIVTLILGIVFALAFAVFMVMSLSKTVSVKIVGGLKYFFVNVWKSKWMYLIILPSFALLCIFSLYPSVASIINSFYDYELGKPKIFVGFENYRELFVDNSALILEIARNTVLMVGTYLLTHIVPPVLYAFLINLLRNKNSVNVIRLFLYIPILLPTIATMLMWRYGIYGINPNGAINTIIVNVFGGEPIPFLGSSDYAIWSILFIGFPWTGGFLLFYGALMNIPNEIYDALELDGCGLVRRFFAVDLPFIVGQVKYVAIGALIAGVKSVGRVMATTGGTLGTMTMMYKLYDYLTQNRYGMASAIAVIMVVLLAGISIARVRKMLKRENSYD